MGSGVADNGEGAMKIQEAIREALRQGRVLVSHLNFAYVLDGDTIDCYGQGKGWELLFRDSLYEQNSPFFLEEILSDKWRVIPMEELKIDKNAVRNRHAREKYRQQRTKESKQ
jgi:hypothetical protein